MSFIADQNGESFNINTVLGRKVVNISQSKYKFIKPKARIPLRKKLADPQ